MNSNNDKDQNSRKYQTQFSGRDLRASSIGWEIALPIVGGPVLGYFVDRQFETGVTFTIVFLVIGLIFSAISLVRFIQYEFTIMEKEKKEKENKINEQLDQRH